jgi:transketolase
MAVEIKIIPVEEYKRVKSTSIDTDLKLTLIADMCRINTLAEVKRAGSGHLGSSFSAMDIVTWLYEKELNTLAVGLKDPGRDIYFSSKGHDVPGLYAALYFHEVLTLEQLMSLRKLGGLDGHPDNKIPGLEANTGSLGMGISKGKGMAWAKTHSGAGGRVLVMVGDGELQEGQNYEALNSAAQHKIGNLIVVVDHNKVQTDHLVKEVIDLRDLENKFKLFGWHVASCDGHDFNQLEAAFSEFARVKDVPKILIANTLKGRGVSFMEHPQALEEGKGLYAWHSGAPNDEVYQTAYNEMVERVNQRLQSMGLSPLNLQVVPRETTTSVQKVSLEGEPVSQAAPQAHLATTDEYVSKAYGEVLVKIAAKRKDIVVLDGDLAADCKVRDFENIYPERFIENGIAEQDMVSTAAGLASQGLLPVVNSFSSFLASRANEQIYNAASEGKKIIYALHYAGLIPAGPGKSHQSLRDISLLGALPNCIVLQPVNSEETRMVMEYCVEKADETCAVRFIIGPSPRKIELPATYRLQYGRGVALSEGAQALMFAYGPVLVHEALLASEYLSQQGFGLKVINMPWLNRVDADWLKQTLVPYQNIFVVEDHHPQGGLGDCLLDACAKNDILNKRIIKFAVEGYPACGTPPEALKFHQLDGLSLVRRVLQYCG